MTRPLNWSLLGEFLAFVGGLASLTAIFIGHPVAKWIGRQWARLNGLRPSVRMEKQLAEILKELRPNGGESLKDRVIQMASRQVLHYARQAIVADATPAVLWQSDTEGRQIWSTRRMSELTGHPANELKGWGWINTIHPADRERVRKHWIEALVEQRIFDEDCRCVTMNGEVFDVHLHAEPYRDTDGGEIVCFIGEATVNSDLRED